MHVSHCVSSLFMSDMILTIIGDVHFSEAVLILICVPREGNCVIWNNSCVKKHIYYGLI